MISKRYEFEDNEAILRFDIHDDQGINIAYAVIKPKSTEGDGPFIAGLYIAKSCRGRFLSKLILNEIEKEFPNQTLRLLAKPYKDKQMSKQRLIRLYKLFGFKSEEKEPERMYKILKV